MKTPPLSPLTSNRNRPGHSAKLLVLSMLAGLVSGCRTGSSDVLAHTSTLIGADISESTQTTLPKLKLGYARDELAIVPTNRRNSAGQNSTNALETHYKEGAKDSANVLMEIHASSMIQSLTFGANIYQRLAVGDIAVTQPGAAFMLAKKNDGSLDGGKAQAVSDAISNSRQVFGVKDIDERVAVFDTYRDALADDQKKKQLDDVILGVTGGDFGQLKRNPSPTAVGDVFQVLKKRGLLKQ